MENTITSADIDFASLDLLPYGIIVLDVDGNVVFYNDREEEIAGRDRTDVLGRNFFTEIAPCTQVAEFHGRFRDAITGEGLTAEFGFRFPFQPKARDVEIAMTGFHVDGRPLCLVAVRDVTESELVREHILLNQKFAGVGEVAAGVAHNFNNALMAIGTWAAILQRESANASPRAKRALREIERVLEDGRAMVDRIRAEFGQQAQAANTEADVNTIVRAAVEQAQARAAAVLPQLRFNVDLTQMTENVHVAAPPSELREVVVNLVSNAFEASPNGGTVFVSTIVRNGQVSISVRDLGIGMSPEVQQKIFRPLFTTKGAQGTGLGLSTSYAAIRRHGGSLTFESQPGLGTTFIVSLPLLD